MSKPRLTIKSVYLEIISALVRSSQPSSLIFMLPWYINNELLLILAYLLGSIPTGYLAGRLLKGIDIRDEGSGSIGATNVLRTLGRAPAIVVLLIDALKGVLAIAAVNFAFTRLPGWLYYTKVVDVNLANWQPFTAVAVE